MEKGPESRSANGATSSGHTGSNATEVGDAFQRRLSAFVETHKSRSLIDIQWSKAVQQMKRARDTQECIDERPRKGRRGLRRDIAAVSSSGKHWTLKRLDEMTDRDWDIFREDLRIHVGHQGSGATRRVPAPIRCWEEARFCQQLYSNVVEKRGFKDPSLVQMQCIPAIQQRRDLIGIAETGSGKTAAYVLPLIHHILQRPPLQPAMAEDGPYTLIVSPTRDLAQQIYTEFTSFSDKLGLSAYCAVGGAGTVEQQASAIANGLHLLIGTVGRLNQLLERRALSFNNTRLCVIDEVDNIVDGRDNERELYRVLEYIPHTEADPRQLVMYSATMPRACEDLAKKYLVDPVVVRVAYRFPYVDQRFEFLGTGPAGLSNRRMDDDRDGEGGASSGDSRQKSEKRSRMMALLQDFRPPIIVFCNSKLACNSVAGDLEEQGITVCLIHGDVDQQYRETELKKFRRGGTSVLVTTDVLARGLDVPGVQLVLNHDAPPTVEQYIHRIGRTGRAGRDGTSVTFLTPEDFEFGTKLKSFLSDCEAASAKQVAEWCLARSAAE